MLTATHAARLGFHAARRRSLAAFGLWGANVVDTLVTWAPIALFALFLLRRFHFEGERPVAALLALTGAASVGAVIGALIRVLATGGTVALLAAELCGDDPESRTRFSVAALAHADRLLPSVIFALVTAANFALLFSGFTFAGIFLSSSHPAISALALTLGLTLVAPLAITLWITAHLAVVRVAALGEEVGVALSGAVSFWARRSGTILGAVAIPTLADFFFSLMFASFCSSLRDGPMLLAVAPLLASALVLAVVRAYFVTARWGAFTALVLDEANALPPPPRPSAIVEALPIVDALPLD